jgi:hypothetical protein
VNASARAGNKARFFMLQAPGKWMDRGVLSPYTGKPRKSPHQL